MKRIVLVLLFLFLSFILLSCARQPDSSAVTNPETQIGSSASGSPWQGDVPGAAPNFIAEQREPFNLFTSIRDPQFLRTAVSWGRRLQLNQGGSIWFAALILLLVGMNVKNWFSRQNLDLILLLVPAFFLVDMTIIGNSTDAIQSSFFGFLYLGLFLSTLILFIRAMMRTFETSASIWVPNLPRAILMALTIFMFLVSAFRTLIYLPNDAGHYTNLGAHRMLETGRFPYGDKELRGGAAATYGPVLYLVHIPFQLVLKPITNGLTPGVDSFLRRVVVGGDDLRVDGPPVLATKLVVVFFLFLGAIGLYLIGRRMASPEIGWALALLYVSSPYIMGLGGDTTFIGGVTYVSHIVPSAITILAFLAIGQPLLSGGLLAIGAGALFYPAFLFPAWLGYYFWKKGPWVKFTAGFLGTVAVILVSVLLLTDHAPGENVLKVLYESTVGHQEAGGAYGSSTFSFWSTQPGLAALWQKTLVPGWYLLRPSVIVFGLLIVASFFLARGRSLPQFAFLTSAVIIAVQLWKSHAGGSYVEWYYPFSLIGLLIPAEAQVKKPVSESLPEIEAALAAPPVPGD